MARKPNYDFERNERERLKKLKKAERAETKVKQPEAGAESADSDKSPTEE